jgi:DNA polymerase-4
MDSPEISGLRWLFLDLNSYFASVEQQENPSLRGKPVAVVPMMTDATCAIAASYEAKAYGVKTGTKIYDAKRMCPGLQLVLARHDKYVEYHHRILKAVDKHIPIGKIWSVDEFDCELMGRQKDPENAIALAHAIKRQIWRDVGTAINCSIGIAPNSFLAKVATDMQKPDGLVLIEPDKIKERILPLRLTDLPGINVNMEERLRRARIRTMQDFWETSPKQARAIWGSVQGERFWYWLHGYNPPVQKTNTCMVGHSRMLDPDLRTPEKTRLIARRLLFKATNRLRRKELYANKLSFSVRTLDGKKWSADTKFPAANDHITFLEHLEELWHRMAWECFGCAPAFLPKRITFKKTSVILHGLEENGKITDDLFDTSIQENRSTHEKRERISKALEHLQDKYKREMVLMGVTPQTLAGHVGTKIAFSRVPTQEEFWD